MDITKNWQSVFLSIKMNWLRKGIQMFSVTFFSLFLHCPSECLIFCNEISSCKKKTIGQKYEKCFQFFKANVDLNRSRSSWLTAADN